MKFVAIFAVRVVARRCCVSHLHLCGHDRPATLLEPFITCQILNKAAIPTIILNDTVNVSVAVSITGSMAVRKHHEKYGKEQDFPPNQFKASARRHARGATFSCAKLLKIPRGL